jgi:deaminated glutathione amidase
MKIALIQFNASGHKAENIKRSKEYVIEAARQGASWILLPEVFTFRGNLLNKDVLKEIPEDIPGPTTDIFVQVAREHKVHLLLGSVLEKSSELKAYNTSVAIDPTGKIIGKYRKIHLFDAIVGDKIVHEADFFDHGQQEQSIIVEDFKVGLSICYDLRFPALYQAYGHQGTHILTVPSCFTKQTGVPHWESLLRARAIENLCYAIAPNQVGKDARGIESHGHSMVVAPWGEIIACGSPDQEEIIYAEISMQPIKEARRRLPGIVKE